MLDFFSFYLCVFLFVFDISCVLWLITIIFSILMVIHITLRPLFRILSTRYIMTLTNLVCQIGLIRINITPAPNLMIIISKIISTLHRVNGDSPPPSPIFNHLVLLIHLVHNISKIHTQFYQFKTENHQSWKWVCDCLNERTIKELRNYSVACG